MKFYLFALLLFLWTAPVQAQDSPALQALYTQAAKGDMQAQYNLGEIFFEGRGVSLDYPEAEKWFLKAAEQGHGLAQLRLGFLYAETHFPGVKTDYELAEYWFTKAAEQDAGDSRFRLGNFYHHYVHPPDYEKVFYWLKLAAEGDHRIAMRDLAILYRDGHAGGGQDIENWLFWLTKAAENGVLSAQIDLVIAYESGDLVDRDPARARAWTLEIARSKRAGIHWLNKAAGYYFEDGNLAEAEKYYSRAARKGDAHAQARLKSLKMQEADLAGEQPAPAERQHQAVQ